VPGHASSLTACVDAVGDARRRASATTGPAAIIAVGGVPPPPPPPPKKKGGGGGGGGAASGGLSCNLSVRLCTLIFIFFVCLPIHYYPRTKK